MTLVSTELDAFAPAHAVLSALRERHLSSREIVQMHLDRIGRDNGAPNAIVVPANEPLAAADAADRLRTEGEQGAVLGLPVRPCQTAQMTHRSARHLCVIRMNYVPVSS